MAYHKTARLRQQNPNGAARSTALGTRLRAWPTPAVCLPKTATSIDHLAAYRATMSTVGCSDPWSPTPSHTHPAHGRVRPHRPAQPGPADRRGRHTTDAAARPPTPAHHGHNKSRCLYASPRRRQIDGLPSRLPLSRSLDPPTGTRLTACPRRSTPSFLRRRRKDGAHPAGVVRGLRFSFMLEGKLPVNARDRWIQAEPPPPPSPSPSFLAIGG